MAIENTPASPGSATSVQAPQEGFCDTTGSTSEETVDLATYRRRFVKVYCESASFYFCFFDNTTDTLDVDDAAVGTAGVPEMIDAGGQGSEFIIPDRKTIMRYRTVSGTGTIRVIPK